MSQPKRYFAIVFVCGLLAGAALVTLLHKPAPRLAHAAATQQAEAPNLDQMRAELAMFMVDYHASNLWFAARSENWPLANYYWNKVRMHLQTSADTDPTGARRADLDALQRSIDRSPAMQVGEAIEKQDLREFGESYRVMLQACFNCHKVAGMEYLRPRFPVPPSSAIINVDPAAAWPK